MTDLERGGHKPEQLLKTSHVETLAVVPTPELKTHAVHVVVYGGNGGYRNTLKLSQRRAIALIHQLSGALVTSDEG
jgi:hypothetical protein